MDELSRVLNPRDPRFWGTELRARLREEGGRLWLGVVNRKRDSSPP
jgi:hypothetical protein